MNKDEFDLVADKTAGALIRASSCFRTDKYDAYKAAIETDDGLSCWAMEQIVENAHIAEKDSSPLCDDTGIPHVILEVGRNRQISGMTLEAVQEGIRRGLRRLPGRPMAVKGDDKQRIDQSLGLFEDSEEVLPAPFTIRYSDDEERLRLHILMLGGGPEIRARTYRVFHRHSIDIVLSEITGWAVESVSQLGCSPCTLAVGIGRSHYEASNLMLQAMAEGRYDRQSEYEKFITGEVNKSNTGALGLGGKTSVLATFMKIGPQRASGVRIVCMRPCCCFEPRVYSVDL